MQYFPTLTAGQFQVCIGQTAQCSIDLGSHSVTGVGPLLPLGYGVAWSPQNLPMARTGVVWSSVECQPYGFTSADVGRRIIIFGAGVAGGLLVSNITAVVDAFNCTIADAAATAVTWTGGPNSGANMTVYRPYGTVLGSLQYDLSLTTLGTWGFSIQYDPQHPVLQANIVPVTRQPVLLLTSNPDFSEPSWSPGYTAYGRDGLTAIIGGTVNQVQLVSEVSGGSLVQANVECSNILCAKRVMAGTSWASAAAGKIAEDITGSLNPAGDCIGFVCGGGASPTTYGPTLTDYSVDPWTFVADALDSLMTAISTGAEPYYWTITPWRVVYMGKTRDSVAAPWSASDTDGSDGNVLIQVSKTDTLEKYANNVYLEASHILADAVSNEAFSGDGTKREFQTSQPIAITPQIQVNLDGHGYVADTSIGVYNVDSGYHWYWSPDSNSVYQDASQTVLGTHDAVAVIYFASSAGLGHGADTIGSEAASASIEGGSGKHDMTDSTDVPMTVDAATLMAELEADYYGVVPETFEAQTLRGGLAPGQAWPVHITEIGAVDANYANPNPISYLISEVSMSCGSDNTVTWDVKAVASPLIGGWLKAMRDWANRSTKGVKLGSMNPASGSEFATLVSAYTITAPTLISVAEVDGDILFVGITQDATGHAVTWDTMFVGAPVVPVTPLSVTNATFVGVAGKWEISSTNVPTTGVPPPPIATATGSITGYDNHGLNATYPTFAGSITLPTGDPDYSHDRYLEVFAVSPTGDETQIFRDVYPYSAAVGGVLAYTGWDITIPQTDSAQTGWTIRIRTYNEYYTPSAPKDITGITIAAGTITGISATDDTADRFKDIGGALHAIVPVTISCSNYPQMVTIWTNSPQYGRIMHGWFLRTASGAVRIGDKSTGTDIYAPTVAAETVTVYAAIGTYDGTVDPTTVSGVVSATLSVSAPAAMTSTSSSAASASVSYYAGAGGASDYLATILFTLNLEDPNFAFARLYVQTGAGTGGSFVAGGAHPVYHSADGTIGDWVSPNAFSQAVDHGQGFSLVSTVSAGQIQATLTGPVPSDGNTTLRLTLDVASSLDDGSGATKVTQSTWSGGASYLDLVLTGSLSNVMGSNVTGLGILPPSGITASSVTGSDTGAHTLNSSQQTYTVVQLGFTLSGQSIATRYLSKDGGTNWQWLGSDLYAAGANIWNYSVFAPFTTGAWKWAVAPGYWGGSDTLIPTASLPSGAVIESGTFSVAPVAAPSASATLTGLTVVGPTYMGLNSLGAPYWSLNIAGTLPSNPDPNTWAVQIVVRETDSGGTPNPTGLGSGGPGDWNPWFDFPNVASASVVSPTGALLGNYQPAGSADIYLELKAVAFSRNMPGGWKDAAAVQLQAWVGSATYLRVPFGAPPNSGQAAFVVAPPVGNPGGTPAARIPTGNNLTTSFWDASFYFVGITQPGAVTSATIWQYSWSGAITIETDGGYDDAYYARLTGPSSWVGQVVTVNPGDSLNVACFARSNSSQTHSIYVVVAWYDKSGAYLSTVYPANINGYKVAFTPSNCYQLVPANACFALIQLYNEYTMGASDYFDVDTINVQHVVNQTGNNQQTTMDQTVTSGDYSALKAVSTIDGSGSFYGKNWMEMTAPDGSFASVATSSTATAIQLQQHSGGFAGLQTSSSNAQSTVTSPNVHNSISLQASDSGPVVSILSASVAHQGTTETLAAAISAGRHVVAGIIVP